MDVERSASVKRLVAEFPAVPAGTVIRAVALCVEQLPAGGPLIIEQAARALLKVFESRGADER